MMTAFASVETAVEAMRAGAENFLTKPLEPAAILVVLEKVLEKRELARDAEQLRLRVQERYRIESIVGDSAALQAIFEVVRRAAPTKATVLLLGESGTGKEPSVRHCSSPSCSATSEAPSPARWAGGRAASSWPTAGRCFSTRLGTLPPVCR
jgi:DNA-binding NtrC family response regulator